MGSNIRETASILRKYVHCYVPAAYEGDQSLTKWARNHQRFERIGELDEVRFESLGFNWICMGACRFSVEQNVQKTLGLRGKTWPMSNIKDNRLECLDALGFVWGTTQSRGAVMLDH